MRSLSEIVAAHDAMPVSGHSSRHFNPMQRVLREVTDTELLLEAMARGLVLNGRETPGGAAVLAKAFKEENLGPG